MMIQIFMKILIQILFLIQILIKMYLMLMLILKLIWINNVDLDLNLDVVASHFQYLCRPPRPRYAITILLRLQTCLSAFKKLIQKNLLEPGIA